MNDRPEMIVFLDRLGLGHLVDVFLAEDVDDDVFWTLGEAEFQELGLSLGHRKKLIGAMEQVGLVNERFVQEEPRDGFELRRLSVMFIDMVGSTQLAERLSADDMHDLLQSFFVTCSDVARRFGGYVASLHGDGALVLFGYPRTRVGDAERAVNAAMTMQTDLNARNYRVPSGEKVEVGFRIGVATGPAIIGKSDQIKVGDGLRMVGNVMNRAARLQNASPPGGVMVDVETQGDLNSLFDFDFKADVEMKGIERAGAYLLVGRRQNARAAGADPRLGGDVLGREDETEAVQKFWHGAVSGKPVQLLVSGDPGLGKSTFLGPLVTMFAANSARIHWLGAKPGAENAAFGPVKDYLNGLIAAETTLAGKPEAALKALFPSFGEQDLALVTALVGVADAATMPPQTAAQNRAKLISLLADWFVAGEAPVVIVLEDAHWCDPTTRDLLALCAERARQRCVMMVATSRNAHDDIWADSHNPASLPLKPLDREASEALLLRATGGRMLPDTVRQKLIDQCGGNPLMLESLARPLAESDLDGLHDDVIVPQTIYASVAERLDRLEDGRKFASALAVIGMNCDCEAIAAMLDWPLAKTDAALDELLRAGLVSCSDSRDDIGFYHQIYREVVYERVVGTERKNLHQRALSLIEDFHPDIAEKQPHVLADHAIAAGDPVVAVPLTLEAGEKFLAGSSLLEADYYLEKAIAGLDDLPSTSANKITRLKALAAIASVKRSRLGISAKEVGVLGREMLALAKDVGDMQAVLLALNGLYAHSLVAADYRSAADWGAELSEVSQQTQDRRFSMVGRRAVGVVAMHTARFDEAETELRAALDAYDASKDMHLAIAHGYDHAEICGVFLSFTLWMRGDLQGARELSRFSVDHSRQIDHAHSLAQALSFRAMLAAIAAEGGEMAEAGTEAIDLGTRFDLKVMREAGWYFRESAWFLARGEALTPEQMAGLREAEAAFLKVNPDNYGPVAKSFMARILISSGKYDEAANELDKAVEKEAQTGEIWITPELTRIRALVTQAKGDSAGARELRQSAFDRAIETGAKTFALRIACDMVEADPSDETRNILIDAANNMVSLDEGWDVRRYERLRLAS